MTYWICQPGDHRVEYGQTRYRIEQEMKVNHEWPYAMRRYGYESCAKHLRLAAERMLKGGRSEKVPTSGDVPIVPMHDANIASGTG